MTARKIVFQTCLTMALFFVPAALQENADSSSHVLKKRNIIDSKLTLDEALDGLQIPDLIKNNLCIIDVKYYGFDSLSHIGQIVTVNELQTEIAAIFDTLYRRKFPIERVIPLVNYGWSDKLSMAANNTYCFNYRKIKDSQLLSQHAFGRAIDINPMQNPYIKYGTNIKEPLHATYDERFMGTITENSIVVKVFKQYGWKWGGDWRFTKDYKHFYK